MRIPVAIVAALILASTILSAQGLSGTKPLPPGFIDGSKNPTLIPDAAAYRLVFLNLSSPAVPDQSATARQKAKWAKIGLSAADTATGQGIVSQFNSQYLAGKAQPSGGAATTGETSTASPAVLVQQAFSSLTSQLTPSGAAKFIEYVQAAKARMIVRP